MDAAEQTSAFSAIISAINDSDVAVFGVMDYWTFDGYLAIKSLQGRNGKPALSKTVLPGMKLRVEAPVEYRLNIHVLLSDELSTQHLQDFKNALLVGAIDRPLSDGTNDVVFLGFTFRGTRLRWSDEAFGDFRHRIRQLTGRSWGVSMDYRLNQLAKYLRGWMNYFGISDHYRPVPVLDHWVRRRVRMCYWKQWRRTRTKSSRPKVR